MKTFHANGKLLLTGEYAVLDGAKAIGLPTKLGQKLTVEPISRKHPTIHWKALLEDGSLWFETEISLETYEIDSFTDENSALKIAEVMEIAHGLGDDVLNGSSYKMTTQLEFPKDWGLGSSSTLVVLISQFLNIDSFKLLEKTFGGSGYDVSCAMIPRPQTFQLTPKDRIISFIEIDSNITQHLYFVYLNQKQNSRKGIERYKSFPKDKKLIKAITDITQEVVQCDNLQDFEDLIHVHEHLISNHLRLPTVHEKLFSDYNGGEVKSLGAWGGDFVLVTSENGDLSYFRNQGFDVVFSYDELIKK